MPQTPAQALKFMSKWLSVLIASFADFVRRTFAGRALRGQCLHDAAQCSKSDGAKPSAVHEGVGGQVLGGEANGVLYKIERTKQKSIESYLLTNRYAVF
jgi:hypothetical protein